MTDMSKGAGASAMFWLSLVDLSGERDRQMEQCLTFREWRSFSVGDTVTHMVHISVSVSESDKVPTGTRYAADMHSLAGTAPHLNQTQ